MRSAVLKMIRPRHSTGVASQLVLRTLQARNRHSAISTSTRTRTLTRKLLKLIARHFAVQRRAAESERQRRLAQVSLVQRNGLLNGLFFKCLEIQGGRFRR